MSTKIIKNVLLVLIVMISSLTARADSESSSKSNPPANGTAILKLQAHEPNTKRMPSRNYVELIYSDGNLFLTSNLCNT